MKKASFAAGCFWGVEEAFRKVPGVIETTVGYEGGTMPDPTYKEVCAGDTGHAETVEVDYDPDHVEYEELLEVFWNSHDPTQVDRQGLDVGEQYRSAIFYHDEQQREIAVRSRDLLQASGRFPRPLATHIVPASEFWPAEEYHQRYFEKQGISH